MELLIIIWSIILNSSFVYVWVNKEKLKKWKPVKIKEDKNNEVVLGKINGFTMFNFIYILLTSKASFELLKKLGKLSRLEIYITNHSELKILDKIAKFLFDSGSFITLFIGLTGMLVAIYIYAVSIDNKLKKFMLLTLIGKEELFYLSFNIVILFFFWSKSIFVIGPIGYLIYLLTNSVKWILKINSESSYKKNFDEVLLEVFAGKPSDIKDLYIEVKKSLYKAVKEEELMEIDENIHYFNELLDKYSVDLKEEVENQNEDSIVRFLYDLYDEAYRNKNDSIFHEISYLHIDIAEYYRKNNDKESFYWALYGMTKVYDYCYRDGTDKFELSVVSGFRFDTFGFYEQYKENFQEGKLWYCQKFKAIVEVIKKTLINDDFYFFQQFTYLIENEFKYKKEIKKDYKLLERSVYFGILLYLREEKRKNLDDENTIKKMDEYIKFVEKFLSKNDLIDLIELYEFIGEEMVDNIGMLNWNEYFRPEIELIRVEAHEVRTKDEIKKLFFEMLGKVEFNGRVKDCILTGKLERYVKFNSVLNRTIKIDKDKLLKRINKFKRKANWLQSDLGQYKKELTLTNEEYEKVRQLFEEIKLKTKNQEDKTVADSEISKSKINIFKEKLEKILSESRVIKWLNNLGKYKEGIKEKKGKIRYIGQYMQKKFFVELGDEGGTKAIAESYGRGQNRAIEQIIIESIEIEKEKIDSIEEALEKIKGKPWIILTGIDIYSFFYEESGKSRKNIVLSTDLDKGYFEKYGEILEGIYKYKGTEIPIYNFSSDKKGIYILDSDDIVEFVHYDPEEEDENSKNIEKRFDKKVGYSHLTIIETEKIIKSGEIDKILKSGILKEYETEEEKLNQFKQLIWITFVQKGELKLRDNAVVYKVEFNG